MDQNPSKVVPMPVELVDKFEDKDEDVDADQTRTGRHVGGQQSTQCKEYISTTEKCLRKLYLQHEQHQHER